MQPMNVTDLGLTLGPLRACGAHRPVDTTGSALPALQVFQIRVVVAAHLVDAVAAELFEEGSGHHDGHHGLPDDSSRPALLEARWKPTSSAKRISSWTCEPGRRAASKPSPISAPLIAWMEQKAWARRPSSLRSHWTYEPSPTGQPRATTSKTPPKVSPPAFAWSMASIMARSAAGSAHRTSDASARCRMSSQGSSSGPTRTPPISVT